MSCAADTEECSSPKIKSSQPPSSVDETTWLLNNRQQTERQTHCNPSSTRLSNGILDSNRRPYRYIIATLLALAQFVLAYAMELPAGLEATIIRVMKIDNAHYSVIFSAYSWADIIMSLVGSVIANKYLGIRKGFAIFMSIVTLGQLLCAVGCYLGSFWIFLSGRLIIGCGNGTTTSILCAFQIIWFGGKEIAFVMSLARTMGRLAATLALFTPQITYDGLSTVISSPLARLSATQMIGTLICAIGVLCTITVVGLDKYGVNTNYTSSNSRKSRVLPVDIYDVVKLPLTFWIISVNLAAYYGIIFSFTSNSPLYFIHKYGLNLQLANTANSLSYSGMIIIAPFISLLIDLTGYVLIWGTCGLMFPIVSCLLYMYGGNGPAIPFIGAILLSVSFALFSSSIWVAPGFIVEPHQVSTAYGIVMSLMSTCVALISISSGVILDHMGYYFMLLFNLLILVSMILTLIALFTKEIFSEEKTLNISASQRRLENNDDMKCSS